MIMSNTVQYPNPELQEKFDIVWERLQRDEKYLDFCAYLNELTDRQYRALYCFVKYAPADDITDNKQFTEDIGENYKYAARF